ncbi:hypothetical protein Tco_0359628 [Tanacetum coccineum]
MSGFRSIIDFITRSHIYYALTKKPEVCVSFIKQFWRTAELLTDDNGTVKIHATIDGHSLSITEGSLRRHLKLDDQGMELPLLPTTEILLNWRLWLYNCSDNPKKTAWEQFSSNIAAAVICLATNRKFNFSRMIFDHMQYEEDNKGFFRTGGCLISKYLLFQLHSASPSNSISSPEPTPTQPSPTQPSPQPSPIQPSPTHLSPTQPGSEYHPPTPHDSPLHAVHSHGSDEGSLKLQELMNLINTLSDKDWRSKRLI